MPSCGAPGCRNRSTDKPEDETQGGKKLSFHLLPSGKKKDIIRSQWLHNVNRQELPKYLYICSEHFEESCFKQGLRAELVPGAKPKRELFEDAVPTIFNHKPLPKK